MCVIMIAINERPNPLMVAKAWSRNEEGAGVAWREKGQVRWAKGLELDELQSLVAKLPIPFIMHCRKVTVGGDSLQMTHPFQVDPLSSLELEGSTNGYVLFHNGTWHPWKDKIYDAAVRSNTKIPGGRWSDSRALGFIASIYGPGALEVIDEKTAILGPKDLQVYGSGWVKREGVICSNSLWEGEKVDLKDEKKVIIDTKKDDTKGEPGGASQEKTFRTDHQGVQRGEDLKEGLEASAGEVSKGHEGNQSPESSKKSSPIVIDDDTITYSMASEEDRIKMLEWVRSKNPSPFRSPLASNNSERVRRVDNARDGIIHLGKL